MAALVNRRMFVLLAHDKFSSLMDDKMCVGEQALMNLQPSRPLPAPLEPLQMNVWKPFCFLFFVIYC